MKLPIDTAALKLTCSLPPEPVMDFTSKQQKADANGEPLNSVELVAFTPRPLRRDAFMGP